MDSLPENRCMHYNCQILHHVPDIVVSAQRPPTLAEYEYEATLAEIREHEALQPCLGLFSRFSNLFTTEYGGFFLTSGNHPTTLLVQRKYPQTRKLMLAILVL